MKPITLCVALLCAATTTMSQELKFKKLHIEKDFRSEGVTAFDVNRDGKVDIVTDHFWYEAPNWKPHEIRTPKTWQLEPNQYSECFSCFHADVNGDGYDDLLVVRFPGAPMHWLENPKGQDGHWTQRELFFSCANESPLFLDINKDGKNEMILAIHSDKATPEQKKAMGWCNPDPSDPNKPWLWHAISGPNSPGGDRFAHGLGIGDVNGDGRPDLLIAAGWYEAPADPTQPNWQFHPVPFSGDGTCAHMYTYDINGDGRPDVLCSSAHKFGIWWNEQTVGADGKPAWTRHEIDKTFSQTHAVRFEDLDGDGVPEIITGKRFYAHGKGGDPGWDGPAVLVYYKLKRDGKNATWEKHIIDDDSGVGTQFEVADVNGDGKLDIVVSNKKGLFYFEQQK